MSKPLSPHPWAQTLAAEVRRPVFPKLPAGLRPYLLALTLFAAAGVLMHIGDAALIRFGLPWSLVSLLIVVAAASLWGTRPALLVLALSACYALVVVPRLSIPPPAQGPPWYVLPLRTSLFIACGTVTIWLTHRARQMQERAERRREVVGVLQSMILPETLAEVSGYDLSGLYRPADREEQVGGDFYDFYPVGEGLYGLMIGDVMGKGKEAAASTALLRYSVRALTSTGTCPAEVMGRLNGLLETQGLRFETASLFLGLLDSRSGSLCYANAGHEPPLLRRAHGEEEILDSTGPILGVGPGVTYGETAVELDPGDALLLMTDGVTEARDGAGCFLDTGGAWRLFRAALAAPTSELALASLDAALWGHIGTGRTDDIAMLLLRRNSA